jgi:hypothetical protein
MWLSGRRGSGDGDEPSPEQLEAWYRRMRAPDNELPYPVPLVAPLVRTEDLVVAVSGVQAYTAGISFRLLIRLRSRRPGLGPHGLHELIDEYGEGGVDPAQRLLLGLEYPDGRRASTIGSAGWPPESPDDEPLLMSAESGGGNLSVDASYWLTPVPPDGAVTLVCAWAALGVDETRFVVDDAALTTASSRAIVLWPWQPEEDPAPPPSTHTPLTGWFAGVQRRRRREDG